MKEFAVCGLGNAIVDIFVEISDAEFAELGFERGTMRLVDPVEQRGLLDRLRPVIRGWSAAVPWRIR